MKTINKTSKWIFALCLGQALVTAAFAQVPGGPDPVVTISTGQIRGNVNGQGTAMFKNIPFAQPPVGDLRWREPRPAKSWSGVRDARAYGPMCHQNDNKQLPHSEDCLQLNIWTPASARTSSLPVMVWIHGGGNVAGAGMETLFNGEVLASHDVVVVTINYRLGIFGFFALPELSAESPHHAAGNYGLADQILALQWVQDNIATFGGDPDNVTVFGESAGAADVNALLASSLSNGLFKRAIAQSGPVGTQPSLAESELRGKELVAGWGFSGNKVLSRLRTTSSMDLMAKVAQGRPGFSINVDGWVLTEPAAVTFAEGRQQPVPLMIGNNSQEMALRGASDDMVQNITQQYGARADRALALYGYKGKNEPAPDPEYGTVLMQFATDNAFRCGTVQELIWHTAAGNTSYEYQFSRTVHGKEELGAPHAAEIPFIFGTLPIWQGFRHYDASDEQYAPILQQYWTNFAKTGDPNGGNLPSWPTFDANKRAYMHFKDTGPVANEGLRKAICDLYMENQHG